jgi:hypothetical protein
LTLVDLDELLLPYLADHPPSHLLVAGFVGFKRPLAGDRASQYGAGTERQRGTSPAQAETEATVSQHRASLAELRQQLGEGDVHAGIREPAILDFGRLKAATANRS